MIKKIFHIIWAIIFCAAFTIGYGYALRYAYLFYYKIDLFMIQTYLAILAYWNSGATLNGGDLLMLLGMFVFVPINILAWYVIYHLQYAPLILRPLNWLASLGIGNDKVPSVNIKNLKVEEKKSLEQVVQERIDLEKKKNPQPDSSQFRQEIVEKIEEEKNNQN